MGQRNVLRPPTPPVPGTSPGSFHFAEKLESRLYLSGTNLRTGPLAKIGDELATAYLNYGNQLKASPSAQIADANAAASSDPLLNSRNGKVAIEAYANSNAGQLAKSIAALGATGVQHSGRAITAMVPVSALAKLAALPGLRFAEPTWSVDNTGAVTSQGDVADQAAAARSSSGLTGAGVKVGILSDSFNTSSNADKYSTDVASGDLPSGVQILSDYTGTNPAPTDEGRAMAQVIYDSAPGAGFIFDTSQGGQSVFAQHIKDLDTAGAQIIVDDTTYLAEPMFEDGVIAQAAESAVADGITYISAAGNNGTHAYESAWRTGNIRTDGSIPSAPGATHFFGGTTFNFNNSGGTNDMQSFTLGAGKSILLSFQWDSTYFSAGSPGSANDMDVYVLNGAGNQVVGGSAVDNTLADPTEVFLFTNNTGSSANYNLMATWNTDAGGPQPGYVKYVDFSGQATNWAFATNSGSAYGHTNAAGVESVGAASYLQTPAFGTSPPVAEATSSAGPTPIFFDNSGNRLATSVIRQTPSIVGPDNVDNTFFGTDTDASGKPNFTGTSAAAASVTAIAALLLQSTPTLTPFQMDATLQNSAIDMGASGVDFKTGYGFVQANGSIANVAGTVTGTVFRDNNANGALDSGETGVAGVTVYDDANTNGVLDAGEKSTLSTSDGTFTLANLPSGNQTIRTMTPGGFVATTATSKVVNVNIGTSASATNFGVFATNYSGTGGNDAYTLQIDSSNTSNIDILVSGILTYTAPKSILPALAFTLSGGNDSLTINFQNGNPIPNGGVTYDGGTGTPNTLVINGTSGVDNVTIQGPSTLVNNAAAIVATDLQQETVNTLESNDNIVLNGALPDDEALIVNGGNGNDTLTESSPVGNIGSNTFFNGGTLSTDQDTLNINTGTFRLAGDPQVGTANLTINDNSDLVFTAGTGIAPRHLKALNMGPGATCTMNTAVGHANRAVLVLGSLSINATALLSLGGNDMIVQNGNVTDLVSQLKSGFNAHAGYWNGSHGIVSSASQFDTTFSTTLGIIKNTNGSTPLYPTFDGQNSTTTDVLIKYTYYGDADLNGVINGADYTKTDGGFHNHTGTWINGDFNYDGVIDGSDYALLDNMFRFQGAPL